MLNGETNRRSTVRPHWRPRLVASLVNPLPDRPGRQSGTHTRSCRDYIRFSRKFAASRMAALLERRSQILVRPRPPKYMLTNQLGTRREEP